MKIRGVTRYISFYPYSILVGFVVIFAVSHLPPPLASLGVVIDVSHFVPFHEMYFVHIDSFSFIV